MDVSSSSSVRQEEDVQERNRQQQQHQLPPSSSISTSLHSSTCNLPEWQRRSHHSSGTGAFVYSNRSSFYSLLIINFLLLISFASARHSGNVEHDYSTVNHRVTRNASAVPELLIKPEHLAVPIGGVIHLFPRYGYLSLSMRVIAKAEKPGGNATHSTSSSASSLPPRNESWVFLEPVNNVIDPTTIKVEESSISTDENDPLPFHNLFHIDLCEDVTELIEAYFKNFSIEGLDKPWQAFGGGWRVQSIARYFGIDQAYVEGDYRFVLVKVMLVRGSGEVIPLENVTAAEHYQANILRFIPENDLSSYEFFRVVGTHYVHAYIIGNAVYQVFVYDPDGFMSVKRRLFLDGIKDQSAPEFMEQLPEALTMWVKHMGRVFVLNSSPPVADAVRRALQVQVQTELKQPVTNLFKLHNNPELVNEIEKLLVSEPNGVLGVDLRGIQFLFKDPYQRAGFEEALKHKMQLWEINFQYRRK